METDVVRMPKVPDGWFDAEPGSLENSPDRRVQQDVGSIDLGSISSPAISSPSVTPGPTSLKAADYAQAHADNRSQGRCYRYVKQALQGSGAVTDYIPGRAAKEAGPELVRRGYVDILKDPDANIHSPYDAPAGSVLVYAPTADAKDNNAQYGHIEIRTPNGFASDYYRPKARTGPVSNGLSGSGRRLIGVYVNPQ
jgi:hypothetical protein